MLYIPNGTTLRLLLCSLFLATTTFFPVPCFARPNAAEQLLINNLILSVRKSKNTFVLDQRPLDGETFAKVLVEKYRPMMAGIKTADDFISKVALKIAPDAKVNVVVFPNGTKKQLSVVLSEELNRYRAEAMKGKVVGKKPDKHTP